MDALEPFLPDLGITDDHNLADIEAECKAHSMIQSYIQRFLRGEVDIDTVNDCLAQFGIDPNEYWGIVDENIDVVISEGTVLENPLILLGI